MKRALLFSIIMVLSISIAVAQINTNLPWHYLSQVATDSGGGTSVDDNGDGIIDNAYDADRLDGQHGAYYLDNTDYCSGGSCSGGITTATINTGYGAKEIGDSVGNCGSSQVHKGDGGCENEASLSVSYATTAGTAQSGDSATSFFSSGTIEDARLSFTLQDAVNDGGCSNCITDSMVSNTLTASTASTASTAYDLSCTNCIGTTEIADSYVLNSGDTMTGDLQVGSGVFNSMHVSGLTDQSSAIDSYPYHTQWHRGYVLNNAYWDSTWSEWVAPEVSDAGWFTDFSGIVHNNAGILGLVAGYEATGSGGATRFGDLGTYVQMAIKPDGDANLRGTLSESSDRRLKKDITPIEDALEKVNELQGVYYYWNDSKMDQGRHIGLIAQDVQKVFPELVEGEDMLSLEYTKITAVLVEAIKDLSKENDDLKEIIPELEAKDAKIENKIEQLSTKINLLRQENMEIKEQISAGTLDMLGSKGDQK